MILEIGMMVWLSLGAWLDWKHREVPNWLVSAPFPVVLGARLMGYAPGSLITVTFICALALTGWLIGWVGGADAKGTVVLALCDPGLAGFAWGGVCFGYLLFRIGFRNTDRTNKIPGFPGFLIGALIYLLWVG